jgi:hypothetical protein
MAEQYFNRYGPFEVDGKNKPMPFIKINVKNTDKYIKTKENTRFDILSQRYYGTGKYGWLILQANPEFSSLEFDIPVKTRIRIPFPLLESLQDYKSNVDRHINLYGI